MKKPFVISNSPIEFMLVGPISSRDGIIVQSENVSINFVTFANVVYYNYKDDKKDRNPFFKSGFRFVWHTLPSNNKQRRGSMLLFCWRHKSTENKVKYNNVELDWEEVNKPRIAAQLIKFIENAYMIISDFMFVDYKQDVFVHEGYETQILWSISPLILVCLAEYSPQDPL